VLIILEYIVFFWNYTKIDKLGEKLKIILRFVPMKEWHIIDRDSPATFYPTDFLLVKVRTKEEDV
jgi:hypothetical protein